jgi:hypothetical protein
MRRKPIGILGWAEKQRRLGCQTFRIMNSDAENLKSKLACYAKQLHIR